MTYREHLIHRAREFWIAGKAVPAHLFHEMLRAGVDVVLAQRRIQRESEA